MLGHKPNAKRRRHIRIYRSFVLISSWRVDVEELFGGGVGPGGVIDSSKVGCSYRAIGLISDYPIPELAHPLSEVKAVYTSTLQPTLTIQLLTLCKVTANTNSHTLERLY